MNEEPSTHLARHIPALPKRKNKMMPITYYISELKNQLELLHSDTCPDPLQVQECLFYLLESLQSERESLPLAVGKENRPAKVDIQGIPDFSLEIEAELCLLELEAHAGLPFSTPALRRRLPELVEQSQALLVQLPAASETLRHRLEAALALHLPAA